MKANVWNAGNHYKTFVIHEEKVSSDVDDIANVFSFQSQTSNPSVL